MGFVRSIKPNIKHSVKWPLLKDIQDILVGEDTIRLNQVMRYIYNKVKSQIFITAALAQ